MIWLLKTVFSSSVNDQIGGLFDTLFLHPTAPYWYLYALFFIILITPTFRNKAMAYIGLTVAVVFKFCSIIGGGYGISAISYVLSNEIWFVSGMFMCVTDFRVCIKEKRGLVLGSIVGVLFLGLSVLILRTNISSGFLSTGMCILGCSAVILPIAFHYESHEQNKVFGFMAQYTMPIFLMHTMFAAPMRTMLLKLGIQNAAIHVVLGLAISFIGPILMAWIMKKSKWLEFFLYPGRYIKID